MGLGDAGELVFPRVGLLPPRALNADGENLQTAEKVFTNRIRWRRARKPRIRREGFQSSFGRRPVWVENAFPFIRYGGGEENLTFAGKTFPQGPFP